jgi:hypothetical protein
MLNLVAGAFMGVAAFFHGLIGGHPPMASSTPPHWGGSATSTPWEAGEGMRMMPGVFGTVSAVDGTSLTVLGRSASSTATTTFSVDASSAKVIKGPATSTASVADIQVGDKVIVQGPVSGTSVTAKLIIDGLPPRGAMGEPGRMGTSTRPFMRGGMGSTTSGHKPMMRPGYGPNPPAQAPDSSVSS